HGSVSVIGDAVQFRLVHNQGAAFGLELGAWQRWIFVVIALVAIVWLYRAAQQAAATDRLRRFAVAFVAGGAAGNMVDRLLSSRGVVDYIDIGAGSLRWPTFNVADIAVTCGAVALAISLWREDARRAPAPSSPA
ncbi:MAG: signal peptidase II, partial [Gemmatimonadales bacterium]